VAATAAEAMLWEATAAVAMLWEAMAAHSKTVAVAAVSW